MRPVCTYSFNKYKLVTKFKLLDFYRYPKCPDIREKWIEFTRRYDQHRSMLAESIIEKSIVCSVHFVADSFNIYNKMTILKPGAIPSLIVQRIFSVS